MAIPTGPFPALIAYADIRAGMRILGDMSFADLGETAHFDLWVDHFDNSGQVISRAGFVIADPATWNDTGRTLVLQLAEAFTGDPGEPTTGSVVKAGDGRIWQRTDPDTWQQIGSAASSTWADIFAAGPVAVLLDGKDL